MLANVKIEQFSPTKTICLNAGLLQAKKEASTPIQAKHTATSILAGTAASETTPQGIKRPSTTRWVEKLKTGRFVVNLGSPTPPRGIKRAAELPPPTQPERRHARLPPTLPPGYNPPQPGSGCDLPRDGAENPAEPAQHRGDTGGTPEPRRRTSVSKTIHNAFAYKRKYLEENEPELLQHLADLVKEHKKGSPIIMEFKKAIGDCEKAS